MKQIVEDIERLRSLAFDKADNGINRVLARLEYNLTKAYLLYVAGQHFGFTNPNSILNRLDVRDSDSVRMTYRILFDMKIGHPGNQFYALALHKVHADSAALFMREIEPRNEVFYQLRNQLNADNWNIDRSKLLVNMERCRWRMDDYPQDHRKYVLVNIPSFHLRAVDGDSVLTMRVASGTLKTKTPLLTSRIMRMDINPQWVMPMSIVKTSILPHAGSRSYFAGHRYFIRNRSTGKTVDVSEVTREMLLSGNYRVIQEGGEGNSLGRIIFRFDNNLSIFLHDTSSRGVFTREDRGVSHGCIRIEKPYDFAVFLMETKDETLMEKIRYSMNADVSPLGKKKSEMTERQLAVSDTLQRKKLIGSLRVEPTVPIYIYYYTLYPDTKGNIESFVDVYGYDRVIYNALRNLL